MKVVGKQSWSSKDYLAGSSLARLRRVSRMLTINSRSDGDETGSVTFEKGERRPVSSRAQARGSRGTTVTVTGFLWNLKVSRKQ